MSKDVKNEEKSLYPVHCTECGEIIENKFFPLTEMLKQYNMGAKYEDAVADMVELLGIGALYGQTVLPDVPPFVDEKDNWNFQKPAFCQTSLKQFACADNNIPTESLQAVNLNIASMIAQFCMITGFDDIYPMLALRKAMNTGMPTAAQTSTWDNYCDKLIWVPGVQTDPLAPPAGKRQQIEDVLNDVLTFAAKEASIPGRQHFASQKLLTGWRYREENGRKLPYSLVVRGGNTGIYDAEECCCDKCRRPQVWEMGAYPQKIIGILGTQAVGKTSYLMALADRIPGLKFKKMTITHDSMDPQHRRVNEEGSLLWRYQNGYEPPKTPVAVGKAPALTFKVRKDRNSEPVMYTLADIPGEAFNAQQAKKFSPQMIKEITNLLKASDSLILMLNEAYLRTAVRTAQKEAEARSTTNNVQKIDSSKVLDYLKKFLSQPDETGGKKSPPHISVVLTAADKLGDLRKLLGVAFDIRKLNPLVYSGRLEKYVYNTEMMNTAAETVEAYVDHTFGSFMRNLKEEKVPAGSSVSTFIASSGTQCAIRREYTKAEFNQAESDVHYNKMCEARFGIEAPLLWILSRDGLLEHGRADDFFNGYDEKVRRRILNELN